MSLELRKSLPPKSCWITCGLYGLSQEKFLQVPRGYRGTFFSCSRYLDLIVNW